jgi:endoglucanase
MALGTCSAATLAEAADAALHVDQVGYLTNYSKTAMVADPAATSFEVVDARNNQVVFKGNLSAAKKDGLSEETIRQADFSALKTPGTYKLKVGNRESYDFVIGDNVYAVPAVESWRSYTLSRSNTPIDDPVTGLRIKEGHSQDHAAQVWFTDALNKKGDKIDVSGGWYDAGDYGKYITTAGISSAQLLLAYEAHPDHFTRGQLVFPQGVATDAKLPDALTEVKFELDWMRKMQRKDGSTFHKVAGTKWPGFDVSPDTDSQDRYLFGNATASSAMYGASLAIAARVYAPFDKAYAQALKKDAVRVWSWLQKNPEPIYRWDDGQESGSGPYDKKTDLEERIWLAAELFRTTGDKTYEDYLLKAGRDRITQKPGFFTWDNTLALGQFAYLQAKHADPALQAEVKEAFLGYADDICQKIASDSFHCALASSEYTWASTKNALTQGDILLMANQIEPKQAYVEGALAQIHYLFGRNALNKSFMTGMGDNPPEHPHNRIHESTGAYVPGLVVGGPNHVSGGDPDQTKFLASGHIPVSKSYLDVLTSWSTNEYAIDYTATAAYALAWFASPEQLTAAQLQLTRKFPSITTGK